MPVTIHLIRHGHTAALGTVLAGRAAGWPLSDEGVDAVRRLAAGLAAVRFTAIVASPMLRAQRTAAMLASGRPIEVATDPGFDEIDFGDWTGRRFDELHGDPAWQAWNRHRGLAQIPGGETMAAAQARALAALGRLCRAGDGVELAIVTHSDIIKALLANVLGCPLDLMHRITIDPASRSVLRLHGETAEVVVANLPVGA